MSNKTPANNVEKIESEPNVGSQKMLVVPLAILAIVFLAFCVLAFKYLNDRRVIINGQKFDVATVDTVESREKGLSGWPRLGKNQGMLFKYSESGEYCIWMKDMKFNIDAIWVDGANKVVATKENLTPQSYPEVFCPDKEAKYILEIPSGAVSSHHIIVGNQVNISN